MQQSSARATAKRWTWVLATATTLSCAGPMGADDGGAPDAAPVRPTGSATCVAGRASAQFRAQVAPPAMMRPGERAPVSVTFDNCSGERWSAGTFALVSRADGASAWGVARVALERDVEDGERVTVGFEARAPMEPGMYAFSWAIARDASEWFQEPSPRVVVTVRSSGECSTPGPAARFRRQSAMAPFAGVGEAVEGSVTFINCGEQTWSRGAGFALVSALPMGRSNFGAERIELAEDVPFGSEVTVTVRGTAPEAPGVYGYSWAIAREQEAIGEASPEERVTVNRRFECGASGPVVRFIAQRQPSELNAGQTADVDVTFANCGDEPWDSAARIVAAAPATPGRWGAGNVALSSVVAPGFQATTAFRITAPTQPGPHAYRWAIARGGAVLDEPTPARTINVRLGPGPCVRPVPGGITSPYGYRWHPIHRDWRLHRGIDFAGTNGQTAIGACRHGVVIRAGWDNSFGNVIQVDHGGGMTTLYAHQQRFAEGIGVGAAVSPGTTLGYVGSTGDSTGPHLHFEVRINGTAVDPAAYL